MRDVLGMLNGTDSNSDGETFPFKFDKLLNSVFSPSSSKLVNSIFITTRYLCEIRYTCARSAKTLHGLAKG